MPHRLRVSSGQTVFVLRHRILAVAQRNAAGHALDRLVARMRLHETEGLTYVVMLRPFAKYTGQVYLYELDGTRYKAHASDVMRA